MSEIAAIIASDCQVATIPNGVSLFSSFPFQLAYLCQVGARDIVDKVFSLLPGALQLAFTHSKYGCKSSLELCLVDAVVRETTAMIWGPRS